jgi:hypothetical protein
MYLFLNLYLNIHLKCCLKLCTNIINVKIIINQYGIKKRIKKAFKIFCRLYRHLIFFIFNL